MSNLSLFGRKHKLQDIKRKPTRLLLNIVIGVILLAVIMYSVFEFVLKPTMVIDEVVINFEGSSVPIPDEFYTLADKLQGITFPEAEPRSLEAAFSDLDEITHAEITRSLSGRLEIILFPRIPVCILKTAVSPSKKNSEYIPVDEEGFLYSATEKYTDYFRKIVPVIEITSFETLSGTGEKASDNLLQTAQLLLSLQEMDMDVFNLITKVKYDNNSKYNNASAFFRISESNIEFQLSRDLELKSFYESIKAVIEMAELWEKEFIRIAVHNDAAICRL